MIGAAVYRLRAEKSARLTEMHGRLMHAAFFAALQKLSPELSRFVHDEMNVKPFTVSRLRSEGPLRRDRNGWQVEAGQTFLWRVTALHELLVRALFSLEVGTELMAGGLPLTVQQVMMGAEENRDAGVMDEHELIAACLSVPRVREITFRFLSPVSFRTGTHDYPCPLASYVFGSLADKWTQAGLSGSFDKRQVHEEAEIVRPLVWHGEAKRYFMAEHRGLLGFTGEFTYALEDLEVERQRAFLILAQFAVFSGVGRYTGQGFGETRVTYR